MCTGDSDSEDELDQRRRKSKEIADDMDSLDTNCLFHRMCSEDSDGTDNSGSDMWECREDSMEPRKHTAEIEEGTTRRGGLSCGSDSMPSGDGDHADSQVSAMPPRQVSF
jgi:hypothetical protein